MYHDPVIFIKHKTAFVNNQIRPLHLSVAFKEREIKNAVMIGGILRPVTRIMKRRKGLLRTFLIDLQLKQQHISFPMINFDFMRMESVLAI